MRERLKRTVVRGIEGGGEATKILSTEVRNRYPEIGEQATTGMRGARREQGFGILEVVPAMPLTVTSACM